jgi:DDE superfamily endonuclease
LLQEIDRLCGFTQELRPLSGYEPRVGNLYQTLLGALIAHGTIQKPERRALEQDPKARARWIATEWPRIKRLVRRQRALLFFEDESVVRLTPTVGRTWAPVGKTPIVRVTGKRASVLVMSALSLQGRLFFKIPSESVNATVFTDFLKELLAEYPRRKIFVIADQASPHIAKSVKAFVAGQKRLELFYLPTACSG